MTRAYVPLLLLLSLLWGASYLFIKIAGRQIEPTTMMLGRVVIAGLALVLFLAATGRLGELRLILLGVALGSGVLRLSCAATCPQTP